MSRKIKPDKKFVKKMEEYNAARKQLDNLEELSQNVDSETAWNTASTFDESLNESEARMHELEKELGVGDEVAIKISYNKEGNLLADASFKDLALLEYYMNDNWFDPKANHGKNHFVTGEYIGPLRSPNGTWRISGFRIKKGRLYVKTRNSSDGDWQALSSNNVVAYLASLQEKCPKLRIVPAEEGTRAKYTPNKKNKEKNQAEGSDKYVELVREYNGIDDKARLFESRRKAAENLDDRENLDNYRQGLEELKKRKSVLEKELGLGSPVEIVVKYDDSRVEFSGRPRDFILANLYINEVLDPSASDYQSIIPSSVRHDFEKTTEYVKKLREDYSDKIRFISKRIEGVRGG